MNNMNGITLPENFDKLCNCAYTTNSGEPIKVSIAALVKLMKDIPKTPRILTMPIQLKEATVLRDNTILISSDIAEALEEAIKDKKSEE